MQLLSRERLPFTNLQALVGFLPKALARVDLQAKAIASSFRVEKINPPDGAVLFVGPLVTQQRRPGVHIRSPQPSL